MAVSALLFSAAGLLFFMHLSIQPVLTGSMRPSFGPGWAIVSRSIPVRAIRPGMVVIFVPPGQSVSFAHRVISVTGSPNDPVLTTKGDANPAPDSWKAHIKASHIQEVIWAVPGFGRLMIAVRGPAMTEVLIVIAGLFIAITGAKSLLRPRSTPRPQYLYAPQHPPHMYPPQQPQYPHPMVHNRSTS